MELDDKATVVEPATDALLEGICPTSAEEEQILVGRDYCSRLPWLKADRRDGQRCPARTGFVFVGFHTKLSTRSSVQSLSSVQSV